LLVQRPYPVVGVITPWNFPLGLSLLDAVPALLAGCAVVVKPSELTPKAVSAAIGGWAEIGAPPVFGVVCGDGRAGNAVVAQVDFVQFTGSVRTGRAIARAAADRLIPCALELGGKDAMIVLDDADVTRAANAAVWGAMANCGQMCVSVERVYVESAVYDEFVSQVRAKVAALRPGIDMGRFTNPAQTEVMRRHVGDALSRGATALVTGNGGDGPTVLAGVDHSMLCMTEETFGPTLPVVRVSDEHEAVRLANESRYGLSAVVFSRDRDRAENVARRIDAGAVNINDVFANLFTLALPQAGWKESGLGARGGSDAVAKFCRPQAIVAARVTPARELTWYPYTPLRSAAMRRVSRLIGARGLRRRFG
jgi:betaine-aldehyde dehydrogenase